MNKNRKAMSAVIATILFLSLTAVTIFSYQNWLTDFNSRIETKTETIERNAYEAEYLEGNTLYIKNKENKKINFTTIKVNGVDCKIQGTINESGLTKVNLGFCTEGMTVGYKEIVIVTDTAVNSKQIKLSTIKANNLTIYYNENSKSCPEGIKLFGMQKIENSITHIEMPSQNNYNHSLCINHPAVVFNMDCSTGQTLFYLGNVTNSHIWFNTSLAYPSPPGYYNWQEVCIDSDLGVILLKIGGDWSSEGYLPLIEYTQNDTFGGMAGLGFVHPDKKKIWIKITN